MSSLESRKESIPLSSLPDHLDTLRGSLRQAPVLAFLKKFDLFTKKKEKILSKDQVLFEPGEDPYLYIVSSGALGIYRVNPTGESKEIGRVYTGAFIGEGVINDRNLKEVRASSIVECTRVVCLTRADMESLEKQSPETLALLYKHITDITSQRLAESGKELALLYESTQKFQEFRERGSKWLLDAIHHIKDILRLKGVIAIEKHPLVENLAIYKYNTRFPTVWPLNQKVESHILFPPGNYTGEALLGTLSSDTQYILPLELGQRQLGYLVLSQDPDLPLWDSELRLLSHISPQIASMMDGIQKWEDEKARRLKQEYIKIP